MANRPSGHRPAGGAFSSKRKEVKIKAGPASTNKMNPKGVSQLGAHVGEARAVEKLSAGTMKQVPLGNAIATNVGSGGPGKGREIIGKSGTQGVTGSGGPAKPEARPWYQDFPAKGD